MTKTEAQKVLTAAFQRLTPAQLNRLANAVLRDGRPICCGGDAWMYYRAEDGAG